MLPKVEELDRPIAFNNPHKYKKDGKSPNKYRIDYKKSEICRQLGAFGKPDVYYAAKMNKYFKDQKFERPFTDDEIKALDLPIPAEIESKRKKLRKAVLDGESELSEVEILEQTCPAFMDVPERIKQRLANTDNEARTIARLNRSIVGK